MNTFELIPYWLLGTVLGLAAGALLILLTKLALNAYHKARIRHLRKRNIKLITGIWSEGLIDSFKVVDR